ncbi:PHP domain-containing protein [Kitasatospora sp. NPDC002227]|uniref:PHP domain-containing protein n=1 Tax=Kitasatospora sp. NPDC002227 TaxID=3154773 RepID=UPI003329FD7E
MLPPDSHVHSEWSWDAPGGSMDGTCRRALELGLPSVAFTEHVDLTPWTLSPDEQLPEEWDALLSGGVLTPPPLDLDGYRECLARCRERYPDLRILSGVELSEPHWHRARATGLLAAGDFERVLASVHSAPAAAGGGFAEVTDRYADQPPVEVVRAYLAETAALIEKFDSFEVLAHIDYPVRHWPTGGQPYDPYDFEEEHRHVLRRLAAAGKVLEVNTRVPLHAEVVGWWREEGGRAITFASDAHDPGALARGFRDAVHLAEAAGFRPGRDPHGFWSPGLW